MKKSVWSTIIKVILYSLIFNFQLSIFNYHG